MRGLIVNADDFGLTSGVNRGIVRAHDGGVVTSASLMVRQPAAREAAALAAMRPVLSVGLHVDLGEWVYRDGTWIEAYAVVELDDASAVAREVALQLRRFSELMGCTPTHLDSHQHVHRTEPALEIFRGHAADLGIPLRGDSAVVAHCGSFYGQSGAGQPIEGALSVDSLLELLASLPIGITELGCHPGEPDGLESPYADERLIEVETLCDPRVRAVITSCRISLLSFDQLGQNQLTDPP